MLPQRGFGRGCEFQIARSKQFVIGNVTITLLSFIIFLQCKDKLRNGHFFLFLWSHLLPRSDLWRWLVWRSSAQANNICRGEIRTAFALDPITNHTFQGRLNPIKYEWHQVQPIEILCGFAPAIVPVQSFYEWG